MPPPSSSTPPNAEPASTRGWLARSAQALDAGDHLNGLQAADRALVGATEERERAEALSLQSTHQWRLGRFADAVASGREALALWDRLDDAPQRTAMLCHLAIAYSELGLHEEALRNATQSFDLARAQGLRARATEALNRIGICYSRLGDPAQGERFLLQSLGEARELRDSDDTLVALNNLSATTIEAFHLLTRRGEFEAASNALARGRSYATQAIALARRVADAYRQTVLEGNLGELLGLAGEHERALALMREVGTRAQERGYRAVLLRNRCNIAEVLIAQGRQAEAVPELQTVLDALRDGDHEATRMRAHAALHRAYKALRDFEPALVHCEAHHAIELRRAALQNEAQARLMINRVEVEHQLALADRAHLEAELQRLKALELEAEKRLLETHTEALHRAALEDPLTGLANRRRVDRELPALFERARETGHPLVLAVIDLDHFKAINDVHGHAHGDAVLKTVAQILRDNLRTSDLAARLGGEEFLVVLADTPRALALEICERLRERVQSHDWHGVTPGIGRVTLSAGLAERRHDGDAAQTLQRADAALYEAKRRGRNQVCVADATVLAPAS